MSHTDDFQDHQVTQSKAGNTATFVFAEDELKYTLADRTSSTTIKTSYTALSRDHGFFIERNTWLMNVGWLWIALGAVLTVMRYTQTQALVPSFWLFVGAGCVAWVWLRTVRYVKIPCENGTLFVIEDAQQSALMAELEARRLEQLRRWHDFIDASEDVARQRKRFAWLHEEGALDAEALAERLGQLDRLHVPGRTTVEPVLPGEPSPGSMLN
nr:hypothetical protein [uncultured Pseudoxanthomonas sp.]